MAGPAGISEKLEVKSSPGLVQGVFAPKTFAEYGLPAGWNGAVEWQYPPHQRQGAYEEEGRAVNTLKVDP